MVEEEDQEFGEEYINVRTALAPQLPASARRAGQTEC